MKNRTSILMALLLTASLAAAGCGASKADTPKEAAAAALPEEEISVAYQSSVGYAPLLVMMDQQLIEANYDGQLTVNWTMMNNGAEINEGLTAGSLDVGSMGVPVAVTGVMAGCPYKICSALSCQPYSILTNQADIKTLSDITAADQIAITNINSQPHILLAMAAREALGDARALDANLTKLGNADGYSSMISGAVSCHMVISPYNFMELSSEDADIHEIEIGSDVWPADNTALVVVASNELHDKKPAVYDALTRALAQAMEYIEANPEETAALLAEGYDASAEEILTWISDERSSYSTSLKGIMNMVNFMVEEGFLEEGPASIEDLVYDGVSGE